MKTRSDATRLVFSMMLAAMAGTGCTPPGPGAGPAAGPTSPVEGSEAQSAPTSVVVADSPAFQQEESDRAEPVSAADTVPPGLTPLTDEEAEEAEKHCAGLSKALAKAVSADKSGRDRTEVLLDALQKGVSASGVDSLPRCTELVRRDLLVYRARVIESEAINHIKLISFGLASATQQEPPVLCSSAPPTPTDLKSLAAGAVLVPAGAWTGPGWSCVRFQPQTPLRFQYELRMNEGAQTYEIVARGYPVAGQRAVELFQKGRVQDGRIEPSSEVLRR